MSNIKIPGAYWKYRIYQILAKICYGSDLMYKYILKIMGLPLVTAFLLFSGCTSVSPVTSGSLSKVVSNQPDSSSKVYSIFLIGDAGWVTPDPLPPVLKNLEKELRQAGKQSSIIFLGDNIYPKGLFPKGHRRFEASKKPLLAQLQIVEGYEGEVLFIPGNHDWRNSGIRGLESVRRQERFIETHMNGDDTFVPDSGKPGPVYRPVMNESQEDTLLQVVALDTQWWLHPYKKKGGKTKKEENTTKEQIRKDLNEIFANDNSAPFLVVGHHPVYSRSTHGGYFPLKTHLLPPLFGSMYVAYRNIFGLKQDVANKEYSRMNDMLKEAFSSQKVVYASGHDHSLQLLEKEGEPSNYFLISGAGSAVNYVSEPDPDSGDFGYQGIGYASIHLYEDQSVWVEIKDENGRLIYERKLKWEW